MLKRLWITYIMIGDIKDFRDTALYKHIKPSKPGLSDEHLALEVLRSHGHDYPSLTLAIKDARELRSFVTSHGDVRIEVPMGCGATKYHGIYDMWLRDCENVTSISIVFKNVEIPIPEFKRRDDGSIQIPLAFMSGDGDVVKSRFLEEKGFCNMRMSFIPSVAIEFDTMFIKLNAGAQCSKVSLSTVYFEREFMRMIYRSYNVFYVNGVPLATRSGMVARHFESEHSGCTIS